MHSIRLNRLFQDLDDAHFEGRLVRSGWQVVAGQLHDDGRGLESCANLSSYVLHDHIWGATIYDKRTIVVDWRLLKKGPQLRLVLLHEMAHANLMRSSGRTRRENPHGARFVKELRRIRSQGEECLRSEIAHYVGRPGRQTGPCRGLP